MLFRNVIPTERGPSLPVCVRHRPQRPQLATVAWSAVTSTLLPEKTVEIWTAITVSRALPAAQLWSPPNYKGSVDQWIRAGKTWAFELKTAYNAGRPSIPIDTVQLQKHAYPPPHGVPVLYLLPAVPWSTRPVEPVPMQSGSLVTFPWWSWVVPAERLALRLNVPQVGQPRKQQEWIPVQDLPFPRGAYYSNGTSLGRFLSLVGGCSEPRAWTVRASEDRHPPVEVISEPTSDETESRLIFVHIPAENLPGPI